MATRNEIKPKVIDALKSHTGITEIEESDWLERDLGMTKTSRESMSGKYSDISAEYDGKPVSSRKAGELETVEESIDLVTEKANETD